MKQRIKKIMSQVFEIPQKDLDENTSPKTLEQWDSLNHMKLVVALEEEFDTRLLDKEIVEMQSFKLVKYILLKKLTEVRS